MKSDFRGVEVGSFLLFLTIRKQNKTRQDKIVVLISFD